MKKLFWCSWWQAGEDYRPLSYPPNQSVLGWWCSGYDMRGNNSLCAYISADNEEEVFNTIKLDWPEISEFRFCELRDNYIPSDRFPLADWMIDRVKVYEKVSTME